MREIKFRGYAVPEMINSQWQYGFGVSELEFSEEYAEQTGTKSEWYLFGDSLPIEVHEKSIGQYTGFKDTNGVEIFEGDRIRVLPTFNGNIFYAEVYWKGTGFALRHHSGLDSSSGYLEMLLPHIVVIGNIYENHEILKGEQS